MLGAVLVLKVLPKLRQRRWARCRPGGSNPEAKALAARIAADQAAEVQTLRKILDRW